MSEQFVFLSAVHVAVEGLGSRVWYPDHTPWTNKLLGSAADDGGLGGTSGHWSCLPAAVIPEEEAVAPEKFASLYSTPNPAKAAAAKRKAREKSGEVVRKPRDKKKAREGAARRRAKKKAKTAPVEEEEEDDDDEDSDDKENESA
ncbi:hypothetical protein LTS10_007806 [Elasticomyces elasticus]|nr:hypothetical protein LTS10_007806 [Elasticomyces elasticus]